MFSDTQNKELSSLLEPENVSTRAGADKRDLSYIEAWHQVAEANRIFGFGNWSCETMEIKETHEPKFNPDKGNCVACYFARVRITVYSEDGKRSIVRDGCGAHRSIAKTIGEAQENALKGAETDAMKRAFRTLGNPFGLALYDKKQRGVGHNEPDRPQLNNGRGPVSIAPINEGFGDPQPSQPLSNSQRALQVSSRPPQRPNGQERMNGSALPANAY